MQSWPIFASIPTESWMFPPTGARIQAGLIEMEEINMHVLLNI